jgi:hypothetical protein
MRVRTDGGTALRNLTPSRVKHLRDPALLYQVLPALRIPLNIVEVFSEKLGERPMYGLAQSIGSTACGVVGMVSSLCVSSADLTVLGFTIMTIAGVGILIIVVARIDRMV